MARNGLWAPEFGIKIQVSRTTSADFLSSRRARKLQCRRCPASVQSTKATWQTSFGVTQRHCSIFSAVRDSPHRDALFSGRFVKGHCAAISLFRVGKISSRSLGTKPFFTFATKRKLFVFVNAHEQGIEAVRTRDVTPDDELLLAVRAELYPVA